MSDSWVPAPRKAPHRCRRTGMDSPSDGPYFEESLGYCEAPGDDRELTVYHSPAWIKSICDAPGSPFVLLLRDEYGDFVEASLERDDLRARVEELAAENSRLRDLEGAVDKVLSTGLLDRLDERYSRKPGPKPKAA